MSTQIPLKTLTNVHHAAYRCRDAEQTRWFYEEVLGLKLTAAMVFDHISGMEEPCDYMHLFFQLADGSFIAFFDCPDTAEDYNWGLKDSFDVHIALEAGSYEEMIAMQERINAMGKTCLGPVHHDFVQSVYMYDPNGLQVEITCRTPDYDQILADDEAKADDIMKAWTAKTRAQKETLFGAKALDKRGR
ncbi:MAG: VOC family protein [Pseudomonadales bacterium]